MAAGMEQSGLVGRRLTLIGNIYFSHTLASCMDLFIMFRPYMLSQRTTYTVDIKHTIMGEHASSFWGSWVIIPGYQSIKLLNVFFQCVGLDYFLNVCCDFVEEKFLLTHSERI